MTLTLTPRALPHNLPPRSEFIGRERDKALVHEALRSRSYLISDTAIDLAYQIISLSDKKQDMPNIAKLQDWPIGWIYRHRGELDKAETVVKQALSNMQKCGGELDIAHIKRNLGRILQEQGQLEEAEVLLQEVLRFFESHKEDRTKLFVIGNLVRLALQRGDLDKAWTLNTKALVQARQMGYLGITAFILRSFGNL
jgi:tetratricopeptide (TPR) repeat protein